jgi:peptide/nickel transport system permease protein
VVRAGEGVARARSGRKGSLVRALRRRPSLVIASAGFCAIVLLAVFGPILWPEDPFAIDLEAALEGPSGAHPMGTDDLGRDVLARFLRGAGISLLVGGAAVLLGAVIGGMVGVVSGAFGGTSERVLMSVVDAILAFPPLLLAMAVSIALGAGLESAALGIVIVSVPMYARVMRSEVVRMRSSGFIEATLALGATRWSVLGRHIVPNSFATLPILAAMNFGLAILTLAALGFIGLGAQIPTPEWGLMITQGQQYMLTGAWWVAIFPGLGVLAVVVATGVISDSLRDLLDPRESHKFERL